MLLSFMSILGLMVLLAWRFDLPRAIYSKRQDWHSSRANPATDSPSDRLFRITKERTLPIPANLKFIINVDLGNVEIGASENGEAKLTVTRTVYAMTELQANLIDQKRSIDVFDESGSTTIRSQHDENPMVGNNGIDNDFGEIRVVSDSQISRQSFKLMLPKGSSIDARSELGDIAIEDASSNLVIRCPVGDVALKNIIGEIDIKAGAGTITCDKIIGNVNTESGAGSVKLGFARGAVNVITSSGNITVDKVDGTVNCTSQTGDISLNIVGQSQGTNG